MTPNATGLNIMYEKMKEKDLITREIRMFFLYAYWKVSPTYVKALQEDITGDEFIERYPDDVIFQPRGHTFLNNIDKKLYFSQLKPHLIDAIKDIYYGSIFPLQKIYFLLSSCPETELRQDDEVKLQIMMNLKVEDTAQIESQYRLGIPILEVLENRIYEAEDNGKKLYVYALECGSYVAIFLNSKGKIVSVVSPKVEHKWVNKGQFERRLLKRIKMHKFNKQKVENAWSIISKGIDANRRK